MIEDIQMAHINLAVVPYASINERFLDARSELGNAVHYVCTQLAQNVDCLK